MKNISLETCNQLVVGQKLLIASCMMYLLLGLSANYLEASSAGLLFFACIAIAFVGMKHVIQAANFNRIQKNLLYLSIVLPPFSLISFVYLNQYASRELKAAGYQMGLLGTKTEKTGTLYRNEYNARMQ